MEIVKVSSESWLDYRAELDAVLIRKDGTRIPYGRIAGRHARLIGPVNWLRRLWVRLRSSGVIPIGMTFAMFTAMFVADRSDSAQFLVDSVTQMLIVAGIVTTAGVNYMATDFAAGLASPRISAFNFHDSGTGTIAAAIGDTALGAAAGPARVTGAQSNPAANQYRTVATISYTSTLAITEWGAFSASTVGTLWDRRVFSAINVVSGDSIQFTYTLTINAGGT